MLKVLITGKPESPLRFNVLFRAGTCDFFLYTTPVLPALKSNQ